mgnify:FL=1
MQDFLKLAQERYSVRKYQSTPVEQEKIDSILAAASMAPTACNNQPQKIYVVTSEAARKALAEVTPCTFGAPVVFVIGYDKSRSAKGMIYEGYDFGNTDAAIVCTHMMLEATALGLGTCWVGYFNEEKVKAALGLPEDVCIRNLLPTGYAAENSVPAKGHTSCREAGEMVAYL